METTKQFYRKNSITIKALLVAFLTLLMLIPVGMVKSLVKERQGNKDAEQTEIGWKWGGRQQLTGPILVLKYTSEFNTNDVKMAYFLPDEFSVDGNVKPEERTRGVQKILNYQADMKVSGLFSFPDTEKLGIKSSQILWNASYMMIGIPNLQGIKNKIIFKVNDQAQEVTPSIPKNDILDSGITIPLSLDPEQRNSYKFNFDLTLNGTEGLYFLPIGKQTNIHLSSTWKSVEYIGDFIATEKADTKNGIDARWDIFDYNRNFTQRWIGPNVNFEKSRIGIDLELPLDHYQKTLRAVKYAIMFIVLTFLVFFIVELTSKNPIHPVQYLLVSFALVLFYCLLLAFSEKIGFDWSYLISATATIILITLYSRSIFRNKMRTIFMGIFLTILYVFLYVVIQLEDMALLLGSIGLFITLAAVMYASRKIEWYKEDKDDQSSAPN